MKNKNEDAIFDITSKYCLKTVLSFIKYKYILELVKYNKKLQDELGFNLNNYKKISSYQYIRRKIIRKEKYIYNKYEFMQFKALIFIITLVPTVYIFAYASILYFEGSFNENYLKEDYDDKSLNIIMNINTSLFFLVGNILISLFIITCFIFKNYYMDTKPLKRFKIIIFVNIILFYIFYEIIVIYKIYLSYKIKNKTIPWFILYDYILISIMLLYITFMIYITYKYFKFAGTKITISNHTILKKYKGITINDFELTNNFHKMSKKDKKNLIFKNRTKFQYTHSTRHLHLINLINEYRIKYHLPRLLFNEEERIPDFVINDNSEVMLLGYKNIFKFSKRKYLFKYRINEFEQNLLNKDGNILEIILNEDLNKISVIDIDNFEYILIYDSLDDFKVNLIEAKSGNPNSLNGDMYNEIIRDLYYNE